MKDRGWSTFTLCITYSKQLISKFIFSFQISRDYCVNCKASPKTKKKKKPSTLKVISESIKIIRYRYTFLARSFGPRTCQRKPSLYSPLLILAQGSWVLKWHHKAGRNMLRLHILWRTWKIQCFGNFSCCHHKQIKGPKTPVFIDLTVISTGESVMSEVRVESSVHSLTYHLSVCRHWPATRNVELKRRVLFSKSLTQRRQTHKHRWQCHPVSTLACMHRKESPGHTAL